MPSPMPRRLKSDPIAHALLLGAQQWIEEVEMMFRSKGKDAIANHIRDTTVVFNTRLIRVAGRAYTKLNHIELSWNHFREKKNWPHMKETVLHELAHVIHEFVRPGSIDPTHGEIWRGIALAIGSNGERYHRMGYAAREPRRKRDA